MFNPEDWKEYDATMSEADRLTLAAIRRRIKEAGMIPSPANYQPPIDMHAELWPGRGEAGGYGGQRSSKK